MSDALHVIIGAGQIGPQVAQALAARGLAVRLIRRGPPEGARAGVEWVRADVADAAQATRALAGAAVVYHTATPAYHRWPEELLPLTRGVLAGARAAGARLVVLDNLYAYGAAGAAHMTEATPLAPSSKKGALRAEAAELLLAADRRGECRVALARAADFMGPGSERAAIFGERFWPRLLAGRAVDCFGDPDQPHSYSYTPDVARGLVALGTASGDDVWGRAWHLPVLQAESTRAWVERFAAAAGVRPRIQGVPSALLALLGLFQPAAGELREMLYQWRAPFVLDDAAFRARFGAAPTPAATVVAESLAWARARWPEIGAARAGAPA